MAARDKFAAQVRAHDVLGPELQLNLRVPERARLRRSRLNGTQHCDVVAEDAIIAHENICSILSGHPVAQSAWIAHARGYAEFHYVSKRYRLEELLLS